MRIAKREINGTLILDLEGPFPVTEEDHRATKEAFCDALSGRSSDFIIVLHGIDFLSSVEVGFLLLCLSSAEVKFGALGCGPRVRIVSESDGVRSTLQIVDGPFALFATEREALSFSRGTTRGCLAAIFIFIAVAFALVYLLLPN